MSEIHIYAFYAAIVFTVFGAILGLLGIWINDFWRDETTWKLLMTNVILAVSSIIVAAITKWLAG